MQGNGDDAKYLHGILSLNRQTIEMHKSVAGTILAILGQRMAEQLAHILTSCRVCTQQLAERNYGRVPFLRTIWV